MSNVAVALISAAAGVLLTAAVGYVAWQVRRPAERRDALIEKKMSDRWDASVALRRSLREIDHAFTHIANDRVFPRPRSLERGRMHRQEARDCARGAIPLLGEEVYAAVIDFTDVSEEVFRRAETGANFDDLEEPLADARWRVNEAIEDALKSLPRP